MSRFLGTFRDGGGFGHVIHSLGDFLVSAYKSRLHGSMVGMQWNSHLFLRGMLGRDVYIANAPQSSFPSLL